ncbi:unnamed protein product [Symbiodinium pilosum]|uniref:Uncharacterized protein n=1 Tax=Symbiodinium pilosum TaxID=2952 RepID=A0A812JSS5_SYMPI|nr:unnamed protein product [Symbiodinium pilosum]
MLLRPLDSMRECKLKVWLVIDTCRENRGITTWTNNEEKEPKRSRWHSPTDFQILLACDRGRLARDQPSLADALIHAMQDSSKDLEAVCKEAQAEVDMFSSGSFVYNIINTCLLASAMSVFFQLLASQPLQGTLQREWDCFGRAFNLLAWYFLRSFLPTAFLGELFVMVFARSTESTEEFVEQENKFYLVFLILGVLLAWLGLKVSATSRVRDGSREHTKLRRIVFQLFIVKLVWFLCRGSHWALMCSQLRLLASKYNFFMVVMERLCALQTMLLLKEFSLRPLHGMVASPSRH